MVDLALTLPEFERQLARWANGLRAECARRTMVFGSGLFGEPAWDILLRLFDRHARGLGPGMIKVVTEGICQSTARHHVAVLAEKNLVRTLEDARDGRRVLLELTEVGLCAMRNSLAGFARMGCECANSHRELFAYSVDRTMEEL